MTRLEILELLDELLSGCECMQTEPDDPSGLNAKFTVDSEALRAKIRERIDHEKQLEGAS